MLEHQKHICGHLTDLPDLTWKFLEKFVLYVVIIQFLHPFPHADKEKKNLI